MVQKPLAWFSVAFPSGLEELRSMRRSYLGSGLFLALALTGAAAAPPAKRPGQPALDSDNLTAGRFTGKLLTTPGTDGTFTVQIQYQQVQVNPNARNNPQARNIQNELAQIQRLEVQMARSRNPQAELNRINQIVARIQQRQAQAVRNLYKVTTATKNVDFHATEDVKVRYAQLPPVYDDKGNLRRYTKEELKEFKGKDTSLPGYEGTLANLQVNQTVQVTLVAKDAPSKKPSSSSSPGSNKNPDLDKDALKDAGKDKDKDASKETKESSKDPTNDHKMLVKMIVILGDPGLGSDTPPRKNK
jgi:hypothetical protein